MIRWHRVVFLFAFILTMRAAWCDPSPSLYEIQAYEFGGAYDPPPPIEATEADSSPPSKEGPEVNNFQFDSSGGEAATEMTAPIAETGRKTTNTRSPLKVLRQSAVASATSAEPTLTEDAVLYYNDLKRGGDEEVEAAPAVGPQEPAPSPQHYGPIEDEFLPVVGGTIDLQHLKPTAGATAMSREEEADAGAGAGAGGSSENDIGPSSGSNTETTKATSMRAPPPAVLDYYYKPYYTTSPNSESASAPHYEEEGYYYKPFLTPTTSLPTTLQYEQIRSTTPTTAVAAAAAATTTTTVTPKPTLLQKILDGEFNFFNDPVANWITLFTAAGVFFQFFATPFGQVTTGRRFRRKKRVERKQYYEPGTPELW